MQNQQSDLVAIITRFADSGWELIDAPSKAWLKAMDDKINLKTAASELISAIEKANLQCGNCGCEFDPLYKRALEMREFFVV